MKERERAAPALRVRLLFGLSLLVAGFLGYRLFGVQVRENAVLAADAGEEQRAVVHVTGRRGDVVDRFGVAFATSVPAWAIDARPGEVGDRRASAKRIAAVLGEPVDDVVRALSQRVQFIYLMREATTAMADRVMRLGIRGISIEAEPTGLRLSPQGPIGSTLVGFTGVDNQGLAGVEYAFNGVLSGKPGTIVEYTDDAGRPIPFGRRVVKPAVVGDTVVLTIDHVLQFEAEDVLRRTVQRFDADGGSAIVMRAQTGEILALANYPNFNPSAYWDSPESTWRDRAITDPYEPGSTFKIVTATAALDSGAVSPQDTFPAVDAIEIGDRLIHNADDGMMASGHSRETLDDIVTFSHNVGAAEVAMRVGKATMYDYIRRFGFDEPTGVDLPGESAGLVGTPDTWYGSRLATIGFGQGISVTALALARAYCAIANGGVLVRPMIVRAVTSPSGATLQRFKPTIVRRVMTPQTAGSVLSMLRDVVTRGTGSSVRIPGFAIAGKTGTAQIVIGGEYVPGAYTASFVGIVPADRPQYVILVKIDRPHGGEYYATVVAAPAFADLASRVLWREGVLPARWASISPGNDRTAQ